MLLNSLLTGLLGLGSLAVAAPASAERDATPHEKGLRYRSKAQKRSPLIIQQTVVEQSITIVQNQNLGLISQLAAIAEQQFAALVQSQIALVTQLEEIKNNIRINHFKAKFSQVVRLQPLDSSRLTANTAQNTVIVTVTNVIDARDPANINKRYLLNQLLADNGAPDKQLLVMVSQAQEMTIAATPTVDLSGILGTAASVSILSTATSSPLVASYDPNAPFGLFNGSLILPYNTSTPSSAVVFEDPANIIFQGGGGSSNLFVESAAGFQRDCAVFAAQQSSFLNLAALQLFSSVEQAAAAQLAAIQLGTALPLIPPSVLAGNVDLASALASLKGSATASSTSTASETASSTSTATSTSSTAEASATADMGNEG
ncbi:hypothetical protein GE09DRAFT_93093 [Coniochaeta sp. 2T2.1]|nr:hypothetical protein GE09DRAFT_93093 [Coniochaeta sp. 2T2.1]